MFSGIVVVVIIIITVVVVCCCSMTMCGVALGNQWAPPKNEISTAPRRRVYVTYTMDAENAGGNLIAQFHEHTRPRTEEICEVVNL